MRLLLEILRRDAEIINVYWCAAAPRLMLMAELFHYARLIADFYCRYRIIGTYARVKFRSRCCLFISAFWWSYIIYHVSQPTYDAAYPRHAWTGRPSFRCACWYRQPRRTLFPKHFLRATTGMPGAIQTILNDARLARATSSHAASSPPPVCLFRASPPWPHGRRRRSRQSHRRRARIFTQKMDFIYVPRLLIDIKILYCRRVYASPISFLLRRRNYWADMEMPRRDMLMRGAVPLRQPRRHANLLLRAGCHLFIICYFRFLAKISMLIIDILLMLTLFCHRIIITTTLLDYSKYRHHKVDGIIDWHTSRKPLRKSGLWYYNII